MLDYEWGNPSAMILSGEEPHQEPDPTRQVFDHYATTTTTQQSFIETLLSHPNNTAFSHQNHFHSPNQAQAQPQSHAHLHSLYDQRAYSGGSPYSTPHPSLLSLDHTSGAGGSGVGYFLVPKTEEISRPVDFTARIGLNLGGRTYFSSAEDDFVNRLYRRSRPGDPSLTNCPRCQVEGCNADLTHAKHYHRRHKVCEFHSKASNVIAAGMTQRFCQQCSRRIELTKVPPELRCETNDWFYRTRGNPEGIIVLGSCLSPHDIFHVLSEFDNGKRSCRKRLADHNRRRRKSQQQSNNEENQKPLLLENGRYASSDKPTRSLLDSGVQSSSSVTVAVSPPRMSLDCFRQRPNYNATASSSSSSTLFFSSGYNE